MNKKISLSYLLTNKIKWFEDESNKLDKYERNRVRKKLATFDLEKKTVLIAEYNLSIDRAKELNKILI